MINIQIEKMINTNKAPACNNEPLCVITIKRSNDIVPTKCTKKDTLRMFSL